MAAKRSHRVGCMYRPRVCCPRCLILVNRPGLCEDCATETHWITYCDGEGDERYWLRRTVRSTEILQDEAHELRAQRAREKRRAQRTKKHTTG